MKHETVASKAHVWTVTRGADGKLRGAIDVELLNALEPALTPEQVADLLVTAEGKADIARNRIW